MSHKISKIIVGLALISGFALVVNGFFPKTPTVSAQVGVVQEESPSPAALGQDILDLLTAFNAVSINSAFFSSPLFKSLRDFSTDLVEEVPGRSNPFAPIGSGGNPGTVIANPASLKIVR